MAFYGGQKKNYDKVAGRDDDCQDRQSCATSHSDGSREPYGGCGRQAADDVLTHENNATANKADSGDNLRGDTGWVEDNPIIL
jgi:hypothetical protein